VPTANIASRNEAGQSRQGRLKTQLRDRLAQIRLRSKIVGAPSFAFFANGGYHESQRKMPIGLQRTQVESCGIPPFAKTRRTRISCYAALYMATCAAFYKESRIRFCGTTKTNRKSGAWGTRSFVATWFPSPLPGTFDCPVKAGGPVSSNRSYIPARVRRWSSQ
jgi:hypothetical protein